MAVVSKENRTFKEIIFSKTSFQIFNGIFMIICALIMTVPILKVFIDSIDVKGGYDFNLIPESFSLAAYNRILKMPDLSNAFWVSIWTTIVGTVLALFLTTLAAYVLTRKDIPGKRFIMYAILFTMIFNGGLIPTYLVVKDLQLIDTAWSVILSLCVNAYYLILLKNFFSDISPSISESAEIDGCSPMGIFFKIILPMSKPAVAAIGLFYFVQYWNDFFHFIMYISDDSLHNFQVKLRDLVISDEMGASSNIKVGANTLKSASIVASIIPVMLLYPFIQRYFVTGLSLGAIKE